MSVKLHTNQQEAVAKMHNGCILYGDVGGGKTITSLAYYFERVCGGTLNKWGSMTAPRDVYVITTAKVRDSRSFELQAAAMHVHADPNLSTNGVRIVVDSWNNLHKYTEVENAFFIFDEQRVVGYGAWSKAFIKISKHNEWVLLSATPGDTWLDYIPVFIANGWYRNKTHFLDEHVIWTPRVKFPKVLRYQNVGELVRRRNEVLVHMPVKRHTKRHAVDIVCAYDEEAFERAVKKRWHVFEKRPIRDVSELFAVMRRIVNSDSSRLDALTELMRKHPRLIVFYNFDYELEALRTLVPEDQLMSPESIRDLKQKLDSQKKNRSESSSTVSSSPTPRSTATDTLETSGGTETKTAQSTSAPSAAKSHGQDSSKSKKPLLGSETQTDSPKTEASSSSLSTSFETQIGVSPSESQPAYDESHPHSEKSSSPSSGKSTTRSGSGSKSSSSVTGERSRDRSTDSGSSASELQTGSITPETSSSSSTTAMSSPSFQIAEWNGHKHEPIPQTERWLYLVQYRAGAEGWNCIDTNAICFYSLTYSYRDFYQVHGRIDRINTPFVDLFYYHLISRSLIDKAIRASQRAKKNFNERNLDLGWKRE